MLKNISKVTGDKATEMFHVTGKKNRSEAERHIENILLQYDVEYQREISFRGLQFSTGGFPRFDFVIHIPHMLMGKIKFVIWEYDGEASHTTEEQQEKDQLKTLFCHQYGIRLTRWNKNDYFHLEERIAHEFDMYCVKKVRDLLWLERNPPAYLLGFK